MPRTSPFHFLPGIILILFSASFVLTGPAQAGTNSWTALGPDGAQVTALAVSPIAPDEVFVASQRGGISKSANNGATWGLLGRGVGTESIVALAADPHRYGTAYAAGETGAVFRTVDGGGTWVRVWTGSEENGAAVSTFALLPDPRRRGVLYAGTRNGFFRSANEGTTWARRGALTGPIRALAADSAGGWLYAALNGQGVFRSFNQGKSWERVSNGLPADGFYLSLAVEPERPKTLLVTTQDGIYRTLDRGKRWQRADDLPAGNAYAVAFQGRGRAYALIAGAIFFSSDSGATWQRSANLPRRNGGNPQALATGPHAAFVGILGDPDGPGLYRSLDGGATWQPAVLGLQGLAVTDLAVDPSNGRTIYSAVGLNSLYKTTDGGAVWTRLPLPVPGGGFYGISDILIDPEHPATLWVTGSVAPSLLRSDDAGETWQPLGDPNLAFRSLALDPRAPDALWAAGWSGLFHSADGGATWEHREVADSGFFSFFNFERVEVDPTDPEVVYAAGAMIVGVRPPHSEPAVFRSVNGGVTWERRDTGIEGGTVFDFALDPTDPSTLYAASYRLFRSTDTGLSWTLVPLAGFSYTTVATAPAGQGSPALVYTARQYPGATVLRSTDRGETWTPLRFNLAAAVPRVLEVDPTDPAHLLLGTENRSLLSYTIP